MRRMLATTITVIGVVAAIGALVAPSALEGQVLAPGESCVAVVGFQPSDFFAGRWQTATLQVTARHPVSGSLLQSVTVRVRGRGV